MIGAPEVPASAGLALPLARRKRQLSLVDAVSFITMRRARSAPDYSDTRLSRSALPITETELSVIAALAQMGLISVPVNG